ncbi:hypothetical protein Maes01_01275 [Microbulbifer aestuariivivens]|uniref:Uncharacterized protein n=1 Tax=Microbulbifer aestuariivivens TaxID=1908308 RepID=A0ABP9WND7_9GAMM
MTSSGCAEPGNSEPDLSAPACEHTDPEFGSDSWSRNDDFERLHLTGE